MSKATFYILKEKVPAQSNFANAETQRWQIAYRLCQKAMNTGRVMIYCEADKLSELSEFLWSNEATDFMAHVMNDENAHVNLTDKLDYNKVNVLINLSEEAIQANHFERLLEIISTDETQKQSGRERYKQYKSEGITIENHTISV